MINILDTKIELESFLDTLLGENYYGCIYGSYAIGTNNEKSDVDLFIASSVVDKTKFELINKFVVNYHQKNNLLLDEEVPYENKLFVEYKDVIEAVNLKGFILKNGSVTVPKIEKTKEFLTSKPVRLRLIFNALTTPHIFFGKNRRKYLINRQIAEKKLCFLSNNLLNQQPYINNTPLEILLNGPNGTEGEMYLGYKKCPEVIGYLASILNR